MPKFTLRAFAAHNRSAGAWPASLEALRHLSLDARDPAHPFHGAFHRVGRTVLVDPDEFDAAVAAHGPTGLHNEGRASHG